MSLEFSFPTVTYAICGAPFVGICRNESFSSCHGLFHDLSSYKSRTISDKNQVRRPVWSNQVSIKLAGQYVRECILCSTIENVEAGGVEPPSEKRYETKTTCLAQFRVRNPGGLRAFAIRGQNEQEMRPASPMDLAWRYGPKRFGQFAVRRLDSSPRTKPEETGCLFN